MLDAWGDHPAVRDTLAEASQALGEDIARLIHEGPKEALELTTNTQPVMLTAAIACYRAWRAEGGAEPVAVAGHSLGEYSALVAAGALTLVDALPLAELGYVRIKLCLKRAAAAAHQGDAAGARNALGEVGDPAALQAEQDLAALALAQAEIAHLEGRPEEVVQSLTPWCLRWPHLGLASRGLTLLLGAGDPATHAAEARAVLGDAGLGPLLALGLRAALMPQDPALQALQQSEVQRLLASLAGYPLLAAAFKQRWQAR